MPSSCLFSVLVVPQFVSFGLGLAVSFDTDRICGAWPGRVWNSGLVAVANSDRILII